MQGAGIVGITSIVGASLVTAQEETPTGDGQPALRVAHVSPDAPPVDILLDGQTVVNELEYGEVNGYNVIEPGRYQLQLVPSDEEVLDGLLEELFESNDDGQTVLYDQEVVVPPGQAVTAVAFGQVAEGSAAATATPTEDGSTPGGETTPNGTTPTEDGATPVGEATPTEGEPTPTEGEPTPTEDGPTPVTETTPTEGETTPTEDGATPASETTPTEAGATPTEGTETSTDGATPAGGATPTDGEGQQDGVVVEGLPFGEAASFTADAGDYTLLVRPTDGESTEATPDGGTETGTPADGVGTATEGTETPTEGAATAGAETGTDGGATPTETTETPADGTETPTDGLGTPTEGTETPADGTATPTEGPETETTTDEAARAFDVALLVDDLSSPAQGQSRVRVFHAVPDLAEATIVAVPQGEAQDEDGASSVDVSLEAGTVYGGFATGYVDPEGDGTPTEADTPAAEGTATPAIDVTETPTETGTPVGGERPGLSVVVVETAVDGERANGMSDES
jgi:mucin-2